MTKYILESGGMLGYPEKGKVFYEEALRDLGDSPLILWCFFAMPASDREQRYQRYLDESADLYPAGVQPIHIHATEVDFAEQVTNADMINIQGGNTNRLKKCMEGFDAEALFKDKVVAGHSAGTYLLSSSYWSPDIRDFSEGFAILPVKTIAHFNSEYGYADERGPINWQQAKADLEAYGDPEHETYALEEGEFVVFTK